MDAKAEDKTPEIINNIQSFTFYWRNGKRSILKGTSVADAFERSGFKIHPMRVVGYKWNKDIQNWVKHPQNKDH